MSQNNEQPTAEDDEPAARLTSDMASPTAFSSADEAWMRHAMALASQAEALGEIPVGALVVVEGQVVGEGFNCPISSHDPSAHAEMVAVRQPAQALQNYRLTGATLYVTLEPCTMCVGVMVHSRIERVVYGAPEPKAGAVQSRAQLLGAPYLNHYVRWQGGLLAEECSQQLSDFFRRRRAEKKQAKALQSSREQAG